MILKHYKLFLINKMRFQKIINYQLYYKDIDNLVSNSIFDNQFFNIYTELNLLRVQLEILYIKIF